MDGESGGTAGGIHQCFLLLRVEHLHAHINHPARREILSFFAFGRFVDKVFKSVIDYVEVGVEQFPFLQRADANL